MILKKLPNSYRRCTYEALESVDNVTTHNAVTMGAHLGLHLKNEQKTKCRQLTKG